MQEAKTWKMLIKHLGGEDSNEEKEILSKWLDQNEKNKVLFHKVKSLWNYENNSDEPVKRKGASTFGARFTKQKIKNFILNQAVGNLIGFIIGMWVTATFSHYVLEKKGLTNLFGLTERKKVVVHEIPQWLQSGIAILAGFIALELINHFFQSKKHLIVWGYIKRLYIGQKESNKNSKN